MSFLPKNLPVIQRELDKLRQFTESMNYAEKESELEKLRAELIEATRYDKPTAFGISSTTFSPAERHGRYTAR